MSELKNDIKKIAFKDVNDILDFALKSEENANRFYSEWAKKIESQAARLVFEELAAEELKHKEFILQVKAGKTVTPSTEQVNDLQISDYIMDAKASADMDYQDALIVAMHREKMAFKLYTTLAASAQTEEIKNTFQLLAQQEAQHKLRLETIYDDEILTEN